MRARESANRMASETRSPASASMLEKRTVVGLGVPISPSALRLDDEETVAYDARQSPDGSLSTLLAECGRKSVDYETDDERTVAERRSHTAPRRAPEPTRESSFHSVPAFPDEFEPYVEAVDSNLHRFDHGKIIDSLAPAPRGATDPPSMEPFDVRRRRTSKERRVLDLSDDRPDSLLPAVRPRPTRRRTMLARVLFLAIVATVAFVATSAFSVATHRPWLDPRPHVGKAVQVATEAVRALPKKLAH